MPLSNIVFLYIKFAITLLVFLSAKIKVMSMRGGFYGRYPQHFPGPRPFRGPSPAFMPPAAPMVTRPPPFDQYLCEEHFVRVPEGDDTTISQVQLINFAQITFLVDYFSSCRTDSKCW
jgi:hypothetical protein